MNFGDLSSFAVEVGNNRMLACYFLFALNIDAKWKREKRNKSKSRKGRKSPSPMLSRGNPALGFPIVEFKVIIFKL